MQVDCWLPRVTLPFAAPARPEWLEPSEPLDTQAPRQAPSPVLAASTVAPVPPPAQEPRPKVEVPRPGIVRPTAQAEVEADAEPAPARVAPVAPPRFTLQLLQAGPCALLVELPTGEPFASRDPAYLLLKDLLRAAGLPDSPHPLGEPVRWPLLQRGSLDQGPQAALEFVQAFVAARLAEAGDCRCLWLVGLPAVRFAGEGDAELFNRELRIDGLGAAWALPGLELLMDEPARKAELWQAMRRVMPRWQSVENNQ